MLDGQEEWPKIIDLLLVIRVCNGGHSGKIKKSGEGKQYRTEILTLLMISS